MPKEKITIVTERETPVRNEVEDPGGRAGEGKFRHGGSVMVVARARNHLLTNRSMEFRFEIRA